MEHIARPLMICGTASNVGKSAIVAALCKILTEDGFNVAPFKSQNMALNSATTPEGYEIGRAQAVQADCCSKASDVRMNPILLKPEAGGKSQVVIMGKVYKSMTAASYFSFRKTLMPLITKAYTSLAKENDIIVIEGAGSAAEINLRKKDIVNMGLALYLHAPVLIVGNIDLGGVFASLYGTLALLSPRERSLIKGFIINKFRGDIKLLKSGIDFLTHKTRRHTLGVIPYFNFTIEGEDSLCLETLQFSSSMLEATNSNNIAICIISLPYIANWSDFTFLKDITRVNVFYIKEVWQLDAVIQKKCPTLIILPGSKDTIYDITILKKKGLASAIQKYSNFIPILGICGGLQILGRSIFCGKVKHKGLALLNCTTDLEGEKQVHPSLQHINNIKGFWSCLNGSILEGYEIHTGHTQGLHSDFCAIEAGFVFGTYIHGFLSKSDIIAKILDALLIRNKMPTYYNMHPITSYTTLKQKQYEILSSTVRNHLNMSAIYHILKLKDKKILH